MSLNRTPLYEAHQKIGCRMAPFAGWEMPIQFSGLMHEHEKVRKAAGLFDISHMGVFLIRGNKVKDYIQNLVPTDLYRIGPGEASYTVLLNQSGGIIDDLIIYDLGTNIDKIESLLLVINAGCIEKDITWIKKHMKGKDIYISDFKKNGILLALQGPKALQAIESSLKIPLSSIPRFGHKFIKYPQKNISENNSIFIARTGYTGEDGFELLLDKDSGISLWNNLISQGVTPCGLGARDTLRLEAGMHLYGNEMDTKTTPFEAGLGWLVHLEMPADFLGRSNLEKQAKEGIKHQLIGLKVHGRAIARKGYKLIKNNKVIGEITSGTWSPTLGEAIAMGYVPPEIAQTGTELHVEIRGNQYPATIVKRPFYKKKQKF